MIRIQLPEAEVASAGAGPPDHRRRQAPDRLQIVLHGPPGPARTRTSPPTWASHPAPSSAGSTPTSTAASTACGPARPRGPSPSDPRRPGRRGPPLGHRGAGRRRGWTGPTGPTRSWPTTCSRPTASGPAARPCSAFCRKHRHPPLPADLPLPAGRPGQAGRGPGGPGRPEKGAEAGELVLLSQDEARFPMVPDARPRRWGSRGTGRWSARGTARTCCTSSPWSTWSPAALHANTLESPARAKQKTGKSKTRRMQEAFAAHLRHVGRLYPAERAQAGGADDRQRPVAPGQADRRGAGGATRTWSSSGCPATARSSTSIERFWKMLRRRATHNRLFDTPGRPEAVAPGQPVLLPDGAGPDPEPDRRVLRPPRKTDSISRIRVNETWRHRRHRPTSPLVRPAWATPAPPSGRVVWGFPRRPRRTYETPRPSLAAG